MKSNFLAIAIAIAVCIIVSGCASQEKQPVKYCEDYALELVPENFTLVLYSPETEEKVAVWAYIGKERSGISPDYALYWKDGTKFSGNSVCFSRGTKIGQNINYYYQIPCSGTAFSYFEYSKQVVNSEGVITGQRKFSLNMVLVAINNSEGWIKLYEKRDEKVPTMVFKPLKKDRNIISYCYWRTETGETIPSIKAVENKT